MQKKKENDPPIEPVVEAPAKKLSQKQSQPAIKEVSILEKSLEILKIITLLINYKNNVDSINFQPFILLIFAYELLERFPLKNGIS